ncbi:MAG: aminotransferase class I/II-fold pyridoxal phosphate-dependent enzyme [Candidatus Nitrosocaldus sp.]|nr:aminotransferase class I/II-fold pyridoxal phosphate-dependent enzyme [Candidatus Nitrosocaldus sp.]MCS7140601.1 aminotransferase class I/II-fold pyridoxal phosphate-dependent enzyme [Candidatus Nitrosocaldus sp.]MDW7999585.1 aminotransferase class I/II-fold pyridoxal phosphate-dependent enzyme [Candidatus Nitrosocaldus sp.]MDW8276014.1 aminotransferase class I/II-fold pyridoxal phosphate-dependent enzyme [Candidatus Nitrosocaldus sp.]
MSELDDLRAEIRNLTEDMVRLLGRRLEVARRIGGVKMRHGMGIVDVRAEEELRSHILGMCDALSLDRSFVNRILNLLFAESTRVQMAMQEMSSEGGGGREGKSKEMEGTAAATTTTATATIAPPTGDGSASRVRPVDVFLKARMLERSGREMIHLEIGEPRLHIPSRVRDSLIDALDRGRYHYTESKGIEELRSSIALMLNSRYGASVTKDEVIVTPGGRFAIYLAMLALLRPGDEVVIIEPAWPAYTDIAEFIGARVRRLSTNLEDGWDVDVGRLKGMLNGSTRMIILNYPNNPTGKIIGRDTLDSIVDVARSRRGVVLLSDEVYADLAFKEFRSILSYGSDDMVMVSSFSKGPSMTGFRVGYAAAPKPIIDEMGRLQSMMLTCVAEPIQYSALAALSSMDDVGRNAMIIRSRLDMICRRMESMPVSFHRPDGAMYVFARIDVECSMSRLFDTLLERGVAVAPGSGFGSCYERFIRISAGQDERLLSRGLDVIGGVLEEMSKR